MKKLLLLSLLFLTACDSPSSPEAKTKRYAEEVVAGVVYVQEKGTCYAVFQPFTNQQSVTWVPWSHCILSL